VIDHMGRIPVEGGTERAAFKSLLRLLDTGRCWVKLSAPYHVSRAGRPAYADCASRGRALIRAAPERMLWGSNWPHPSVREKPDDAELLDILADWTDDETALHRILVDNPAALFGF
jgi:D-galactarolactone isomerase